MLFAAFCVFGFVQNIVVVHQIALMKDAGLSNSFAISVVTFCGIMLILGRLSSFISYRISREKTFTTHYLIHTQFFFGIGMGLESPVLRAAIADIFHGKSFGTQWINVNHPPHPFPLPLGEREKEFNIPKSERGKGM